jgi:hypothetical protein
VLFTGAAKLGERQVLPEQVHTEPGRQSAPVQQLALAMQLFEALQSLSPVGQLQLPPGLGQVCPTTLQSALLQQLALAMQLFEALQSLSPVGQLQLPPGPGQLCPTTLQSALLQQLASGTQRSLPLQTLEPTGQTHSCEMHSGALLEQAAQTPPAPQNALEVPGWQVPALAAEQQPPLQG